MVIRHHYFVREMERKFNVAPSCVIQLQKISKYNERVTMKEQNTEKESQKKIQNTNYSSISFSFIYWYYRALKLVYYSLERKSES